jgi:Fic family protein
MDGQQKRGQTETPEIIDKWVVFFLDSLLTLTQRLTEKRQAYVTLKDYLNERQKQVLDFLMKNSPAQLSDILQYLPHIPRPTLKRDLSILVERRLLTQVGSGRGVRYFAVYQ